MMMEHLANRCEHGLERGGSPRPIYEENSVSTPTVHLNGGLTLCNGRRSHEKPGPKELQCGFLDFRA
jgi:hypothetical protein